MDKAKGGSLTLQQSLVLEQRRQAIEMTERANDSLDGKATTLIQASGVITGLTGVLRIPDFITTNPTAWTTLALIVAFGTFAAMLCLAVFAWWPRTNFVPGAPNREAIFKVYISVDGDTAFRQVLSDAIQVHDQLVALNRLKRRMVIGSAALFVVQLLGLLLLALLA